MTSGKLLHDFKQHTAAVNCVEFHPKEFLLATASNDRFVVHIILLYDCAVMCRHLTVRRRVNSVSEEAVELLVSKLLMDLSDDVILF